MKIKITDPEVAAKIKAQLSIPVLKRKPDESIEEFNDRVRLERLLQKNKEQ